MCCVKVHLSIYVYHCQLCLTVLASTNGSIRSRVIESSFKEILSTYLQVFFYLFFIYTIKILSTLSENSTQLSTLHKGKPWWLFSLAMVINTNKMAIWKICCSHTAMSSSESLEQNLQLVPTDQWRVRSSLSQINLYPSQAARLHPAPSRLLIAPQSSVTADRPLSSLPSSHPALTTWRLILHPAIVPFNYLLSFCFNLNQ